MSLEEMKMCGWQVLFHITPHDYVLKMGYSQRAIYNTEINDCIIKYSLDRNGEVLKRSVEITNTVKLLEYLILKQYGKIINIDDRHLQ